MKRETVYIKDDNEWNKDDPEKTKMKKYLNKITRKNVVMLADWKNAHPETSDYQSDDSKRLLTITKSAINAGDTNGKNDEKIIHNIMKNTYIDKEHERMIQDHTP